MRVEEDRCEEQSSSLIAPIDRWVMALLMSVWDKWTGKGEIYYVLAAFPNSDEKPVLILYLVILYRHAVV